MAVLNERYDLSDRPAQGVTMDRGKPLQEGVRVKLPAGTAWEQLAAMSPDQIRDQNLYPKGFYPLPHPNHLEGGFVFPHFLIDAIKQQDGRDLKRFDIDFDFPDYFLAEFPPAIYLTPRTDLGDVSQGKLVSLTNYYQLFNGILTPRQLEGLRLLIFERLGDRGRHFLPRKSEGVPGESKPRSDGQGRPQTLQQRASRPQAASFTHVSPPLGYLDRIPIRRRGTQSQFGKELHPARYARRG
jgi:hypothetical protein